MSNRLSSAAKTLLEATATKFETFEAEMDEGALCGIEVVNPRFEIQPSFVRGPLSSSFLSRAPTLEKIFREDDYYLFSILFRSEIKQGLRCRKQDVEYIHKNGPVHYVMYTSTDTPPTMIAGGRVLPPDTTSSAVIKRMVDEDNAERLHDQGVSSLAYAVGLLTYQHINLIFE